MSNKYAKIVSKMNLNKYSELSESKIKKLDAKAIKSEGKLLNKWGESEIKDWIGLWFNSSLYYDENYEKGGFSGWYKQYRAKLLELWVKEKSDLDLLLELSKFAKLLDRLESGDEVGKCKQFIIKMIELLGFNSLLIIGI